MTLDGLQRSTILESVTVNLCNRGRKRNAYQVLITIVNPAGHIIHTRSTTHVEHGAIAVITCNAPVVAAYLSCNGDHAHLVMIAFCQFVDGITHIARLKVVDNHLACQLVEIVLARIAGIAGIIVEDGRHLDITGRHVETVVAISKHSGVTNNQFTEPIATICVGIETNPSAFLNC